MIVMLCSDGIMRLLVDDIYFSENATSCLFSTHGFEHRHTKDTILSWRFDPLPVAHTQINRRRLLDVLSMHFVPGAIYLPSYLVSVDHRPQSAQERHVASRST